MLRSVFTTRQLAASKISQRCLTKVADASNSSATGKFVSSTSKPFTVTTYVRPNLVITKGKGSYLYDMEGREYVDFTLGIAVTSLGHANPEITKILTEQASELIHCSNLYYNHPASELANKLVSHTVNGNGMYDATRVFLCNSGTEANEAALKFARKYGKTKGGESKHEIISFNNAFHGRSMGALSVTSNPKYQKPFEPLIPGILFAKTGDLDSVKINKNTCAVIIEPIQGEGGVISISPEFLIGLRKLCDEHDALLIYDEIQCGMGRTGKLWAHGWLPKEAHPDIFTLAKALGNGFPIAATVINDKVEQCLVPGDHGTTYGGNPLGSKVGSYIVDTISEPSFLESVAEKAKFITDQLEELATAYPNQIECIRGKGLLIGVKFKEGVNTGAIVDQAREYGLLCITAGDNVIRIVPALNIPESAITEGVKIFKKAVEDVSQK